MAQKQDTGATTSEFLQAALAGVVAIYTAFAAASQAVQVAGLASLTAIVCTYIWSRTRVKAS